MVKAVIYKTAFGIIILACIIVLSIFLFGNEKASSDISDVLRQFELLA